MKISALIPYKPDHGRRDCLWSYVQMRYQMYLPQIEVCVGINDDEPFCRAKAVNEAAKIATGDVFIIIDADVVFQTELVYKISSVMHLYPWIAPYRYGFRLTRQATDRILNQNISEILEIYPDDYYEMINNNQPGPLMNAMKRSCFETIGGMDERFKGYGYEDLAIAMALDTLCGHHFTIEENIFHLWHQPVELIQSENKELWERYINAKGNVNNIKSLLNERFR